MQDDVVVTGRGVVSAFGNDISTFNAAIADARCAIGDFSDLDPHIMFKYGAPVRIFDPSDKIEPKILAAMDLFAQFAVIAAHQALDEANLSSSLNPTIPPAQPDDTQGMPGSRIGVVIGTANAGIGAIEQQYRRIYKEGYRKALPMSVPMIMGSAPASHVARISGARGPVFGVTSACASANHAIANALSLIRSGSVDIVICGGTDKSFVHGNLKGWEALRAVSPELCRPFSADRKGLVLGEGAGIIILERRAHAEARGARALAVISGAGMSSDAADLVYPDPKGMEQAMKAALVDAGLGISDLSYINAHGTGTKANDKLEAQAILSLLGKKADGIPVSSSKSQIGHGLGASGALEILAVIAAMHEGYFPATINFNTADPDCPLDVVPNKIRPGKIQLALSNSFAFGGLNVSLAISST